VLGDLHDRRRARGKAQCHVPTAPDGNVPLRSGARAKSAGSLSATRAYSNEPAPAAQSTLQVNVTPKITSTSPTAHPTTTPRSPGAGGSKADPTRPAGCPLPRPGEGRASAGKTFDEICRPQRQDPAIATRSVAPASPPPTAFAVALPSGGAVNYDYAAPAASRKVQGARPVGRPACCLQLRSFSYRNYPF